MRFLFNLIIPVIFLSSCHYEKAKVLSSSMDSLNYYHEKYRPQYHFSPRLNWMNDPNGLVYYKGEYHLFYQHYPDSTVWGPMHWGHAVSSDLIHWTHLPIALYPDSLGYIFSGSAVVDTKNTSGFGSIENPALIAIFTYHNNILAETGRNAFQNQGIAYSTDGGRTWTKYPRNPVLLNPGKRDFRDPKVFWNRDVGKWNMILAVHDRVHIYSSPDLKNWFFESEFGSNAGAHGGVWECPDLFPLRVVESKLTKWVMLISINPGGPNGGSATQYFTGDFDGQVFVPDETTEKWLDWGPDNYAGVTWSGVPETPDKRIFIGWMNNWKYASVIPTSVWRSSMTIPRELKLVNEKGKYFLISEPVSELNRIRKDHKSLSVNSNSDKKTLNILAEELNLSQCEMKLKFELDEVTPDTIGIILENKVKEKILIGYSLRNRKVFIDRSRSGDLSFSGNFTGISEAPYTTGKNITMQLLVDASSVELFIDDGRIVMTSLCFPSENFTILRSILPGRTSISGSIDFYELQRIW